jgi:hypothetical protein
MEPEIAISVWAPGVGDQIDTITRAARALPVGWKLYVKEHPQMAGFRPRSFYEHLKKIPNVKIIDPSTASFGVIKDSGLIIVVTSTVGFEAVLFGKPVITLGNHLINDLSFVRHCEHLTELSFLVKEQIEHFTFSEKELVHFLAKIIDNSAIVDLMSLWLTGHTKEERLSGIEPLADLFARRIKL